MEIEPIYADPKQFSGKFAYSLASIVVGIQAESFLYQWKGPMDDHPFAQQCPKSNFVLNNSKLLYQNELEFYSFKAPAELSPRPLSVHPRLAYVALSYEVGKLLYERYDCLASLIPSSVYKRWIHTPSPLFVLFSFLIIIFI